MKITYILVLFFAVLHHEYVVSQTIISGNVKDSLAMPVVQANVYVQAENDLAVVAFGYTNSEGNYSISLESTGSFILNVSSLAFKTQKTTLQIDKAAPQKEIIWNFTMLTQPFELGEVVVNADIPILVKKDTIVINTKDFTNGTEEVVEDILKKLPGIEVAKDGTVKVQGRAIEKVMVEGDDLFEKGYKLLTKNLHAGVIDKVEILEHFSDNALLKNIEDSDKVALNITLKENQKKALFGKASLGYGSNQFYENKLNLISFNKKTKYYFFGNLNNVGSDAIGDIFQIMYPDVFTADTYIGDGISSQNLIDVSANKPDLSANKYNFNNAELASINGIYNPTKKLKLKGLFFFTSDENTFKNTYSEIFSLPPTSFINMENYQLRKQSFAIAGKWDAIFNINRKTQIEYIGRYNYGSFKDKAALLFNDNFLNENLASKARYFDHRVTHTKKINESQATQVTGRYLNDIKDQNYNVDDFLLGDLFTDQDNIAQVSQKNRTSISFLAVEGAYFFNKSKQNFSLRTGFIHRKNRLNSNLIFTDDSNNQIEAGNTFENDFSYVLNDLYLKGNYKWKFNKFSLRSGLAMHRFNAKTDNKGIEIRKTPTTIVPSLGISWQINKKNKFFGSYKYSTKSLPFNKIYENYVLTDYRSFNRGTGSFKQLKGSFFLASYILGNWSESFLINTSVIYNKDHDYIANSSLIQPNYRQSTSIALKNRDFYSINFTGDRFVEQLSINVKLNASLSSNTLQNIINSSNLRQIDSKSYIYGGEIRSVFTSFFNFHIGANWTKSIVETTQERQNTNNVSFLDLDFKFSNKLIFQFKNEVYYFGNLNANKSFYFTDLETTYVIKKNKLELKLRANNIFNTDSFSNFFVTDTGSYSSSFNLLPRYFLIKMDYRF